MTIREYTFFAGPSRTGSITIVSTSLAHALESMNHLFKSKRWTPADLDRIEEYALSPV